MNSSEILGQTEINTSVGNLRTSSITERCDTYWWLYGRMAWAAFVAEDESENNQVRRDAAEKRDANQRGIGYHVAECKQCQKWFHSFKRE